jgi:hypothetical protein
MSTFIRDATAAHVWREAYMLYWKTLPGGYSDVTANEFADRALHEYAKRFCSLTTIADIEANKLDREQ